MGIVNFSIDPRLVRELTEEMPLKVFVETGTYQGDSVAAVRPFFKVLHTVELDADLYEGAAERFRNADGVHVHHGDSARILRKLKPELERRAVLYWLDAHWCGPEIEGKPRGSPLVKELKAIGRLSKSDVVLIDDARLFMAPPPPPADADEWPTLGEVLSSLSSLSSVHELIVIDDVITFAPKRVIERLRRFARAAAVDLHEELKTSQQLTKQLDWIGSLIEKLPDRTASERRKAGADLGRRMQNVTQSITSVKAELSEQGTSYAGQLDEFSGVLLAIERQLREKRSEDQTLLGELRETVQALQEDNGDVRGLDQTRVRELVDGLEALRADLELQGAMGERVEQLSDGLGAIRTGVEELKGESKESTEILERSLRNEMEPLKLRLEVMREQTDAVEGNFQVMSDRLAEIEKLAQTDLLRENAEDVNDRLATVSAQLERMQRQMGLLVGPRRARLRRWRRLKNATRTVLAPFAVLAVPFRAIGRIPFLQRWRVHMGVYLSRLRPHPKLGKLDHHPPIAVQVPKRYRRPVKLSDPPTMSIVTPSYNQGEFIEATIVSVLEQWYPRLTYVVQDGGSTDETKSILENWGSALHRWEMRPDDGHAHGVNLGFEGTTGEIMAWLNSDDILMPGALAYVARYFERHPKVDAIYGHRVLIDDRGREIGRWVMPRHSDKILSWADYVPQETLFWRRSLWDRIGGNLDQSWPFALDWDLLVRFVEADARMVRVPRFLGGFRVHPAQKTSAIAATQGADEMNRIRMRMLGREPSRQEIGHAIRWYLRRHVVLHKLYRAHLLRY